MTNEPTPADRLRAIRDDLGYTQTEMAEALGMTQPKYCNIEKGNTRVTPWGLVALGAMEYLAKKRLLKLFLKTLR